MAPVAQKVQLTIQAKELKSFGRFSRNADVYAVVTLTSGDDRNSAILGQTEVINSLNPVWTKTFHIQYKIGIPTHFNISIFDEGTTISSTNNNHKQMGSAMFEVGEILGHRGVKAKSLKRGGVVVVRIIKSPQQQSGQLVVAFQGVQLRSNDRSLPDPFFELSRLEDNGGGAGGEGWLTVYRSQAMINNLDPIWEPAVVDLDRLCDGDRRRPILVSLYDFEKNGKHKRMGWFETSVNALLMNKVQGKRRASITTFVLTKNKEGNEKNYGKVVVSDAYIQTDGALDGVDSSSKALFTKFDENEECLNITLRAKNLTKGVRHPYFEFSRIIKKGTTRLTVYRSNHLKDGTSSDLQWEMVSIPMVKLCDQNQNTPITLSVHKMKGKVVVGQCDTTVKELLELVSGDNPNEMYKLITLTSSKGGKTVGKIQVMNATVDKPANLKANGVNERAVSSTAAERNDEDDLSNSQYSTPLTPDLSAPTFLDYLAGGCELQLCIAIDFSSSNGYFDDPSSYHYSQPDGGLNDYERAILEVASIISKYDPDGQYPLWGFGAKIQGNQLNCFQLGSQPQANGLKDIIHTYRCFFDYSFTMSKKAIATEVIENAAKYATWEAKHKPGCNGQTYTVLLILTDGDLQDIAATKAAIVKASLTPLSIIIIGIGDGDFSDMQLLDDFVEEGNKFMRDITKFVQFNTHRKSRHDLTEAVFEEIPEQVVEYFQKHGIDPNPPLDANSSDIHYLKPEHFDEEDFMLELENHGKCLKLSDKSSRGFTEQLSRQEQKYERSVAGIQEDEPEKKDDGVLGSIFKKWCTAGCTTGNILQHF